MEQKEQTCENSVEQNMAEMKCEEEDYSLGDENEWVDTYESMKNMLKRPMHLMQLKFTVMIAGNQMHDIKNILKQTNTTASLMICFATRHCWLAEYGTMQIVTSFNVTFSDTPFF